MNSEYLKLAYERTVVVACRRHLMERYLEGGGGQKEILICEAVPYDLREVPNEVFVEIIQRLEEEEKHLTLEMSKYEFRKRDERPVFSRKPVQPEPTEGNEASGPSPVPRRKGRKPRGEHTESGGSQ